MQVVYSEQLKQAPEEYALAQAASNRLEALLKSRAKQVSGEWDRATDDRGREALSLYLRDIEGDSSSTKITVDELRTPEGGDFQLIRLYMHILQDKIDRQVKNLGPGD